MSYDKDQLVASLVFVKQKQYFQRELSLWLLSALEDCDHAVYDTQSLSADCLRMETDQAVVYVETLWQTEFDDETDQISEPQQIRVSLSLDNCAVGDDPRQFRKIALATLRHLVLKLAEQSQPDRVLWLDPSCELDLDDFVRAAARQPQRRVLKPQSDLPNMVITDRFQSVDRINQELTQKYRQANQPQRPARSAPEDLHRVTKRSGAGARRFGAWTLALLAGFLVEPIALFLALLGPKQESRMQFMKHAALLMGLFVTLNGSVAWAKAEFWLTGRW